MIDMPPALIDYVEIQNLNPKFMNFYCKMDDKYIYYYKNPKSDGLVTGHSPYFIYLNKNDIRRVGSENTEYIIIHKYCNDLNRELKRHQQIQN